MDLSPLSSAGQSGANSFVEIEESAAEQLYRLHVLSGSWPARGVLLGIYDEDHWTVKGIVPLVVAQMNGFRLRLSQMRDRIDGFCAIGTWHTRCQIRSNNSMIPDIGPLHLVFDDDGTPQCFYGLSPIELRIKTPAMTVHLNTDILTGLRELAANQDSDQGLLFGRRTTSSFIVEHAHPVSLSHWCKSLDIEVLIQLQLSNKDVIGMYRLNSRPFPEWFYDCTLVAIVNSGSGIQLTWLRGNRFKPIATVESVPLSVLIKEGLDKYQWTQIT